MLPVWPCTSFDSHFIVQFLETDPSNRTTLPARSGSPDAPRNTHIQLDECYLLALGLLSLQQQHSVPPSVVNVCNGGDSSDAELHTVGLRTSWTYWYGCSGLYSIYGARQWM